MINGKDFIVFSDDWGRHPFSCQHIMRHFLPHNRLLWVNTIGLRTPSLTAYDIRRSAEKLVSWLKPGPKQEHVSLPENLHVISPVMIPFNNIPRVRSFNRSSVVKSVRAAMRALNMDQPVVLATLPNASEYAGQFDEALTVYYCVDDFTVWPGMNQPELVKEMEDNLLRRADLVIAVSDSLRGSRSNGREPTKLLTHGVEVDHFSLEGKILPTPKILQGISHPVIGFYGLIDKHFNVGLVRAVLEAKPDWQVVCIGTKRISLEELERKPNFHWFPALPYQELPAAAACFDAAVIPYFVNEHTRTANPLKLREYMATGKPVVTTPMPEVLRFSGTIKIADGAENFIRAIEEALEEPVDLETRQEALRGESWADKAGLVSDWIEEAMALKKRNACPS